MKRPLLLATLVALVLFSFTATFAVLSAQEQQPVIVQPAQDSAVRGVVQIVGTATHPQFQRYELYYAPYPVPSDQSWIFIGDIHTSQQPLGLLGTWDSRSVPDGGYALRVRVVKVDGNYLDSAPLRVQVTNTGPAASPTPEGTETPADAAELPTEAPPAEGEVPVVPADATPTVVIEVPGSAETTTPEPTPTAEPEATALLPGDTKGSGSASGSGTGDTAASATDIAGQLFNGSRLFDVAEQTALLTLLAFAAVGAFFAIKGILAWLWHKMRP
jgi:hypothetical protein